MAVLFLCFSIFLFFILNRFSFFSSITIDEELENKTSPSFPLILFDVPLKDLSIIQSTDFDIVHYYDSEQTLDAAIEYLTIAQANDLQVMQNMPSAYLYRGDDFWIEWISTLANHNNLAMWYLPEEPRIYNQWIMERLYQLVQKHDPLKRPVVVYFGTTRLERWCNVSDIMMVPAYPEYHDVPRIVTKVWLDIAREACPDKSVLSVQMLFDTNFDGTGFRPSPIEIRQDAYTAVISGSDGLAWYSYERGKDLPELWPAVQLLATELKDLKPIIKSQKGVFRVLYHNNDNADKCF